MRRLIYIPIIHTDLDLGSMATGIEERSKAIVGESKWQQHKEIVRRYWQAIADFWQDKDVAGYKVFQDGMVVGGTAGENLVKDLASKGSINHQIIKQLLEKGAELVQTEDPELAKEEYLLTRDLLERKSTVGSLWSLFRYKQQKDRLLKARDAYILKRISQSLPENGATGICFLGAYHQLLPLLPQNLEVITLKNPQKVREYSQKFASPRWDKEVSELGDYLTAPININLGGGQDE
jgi:hypothetical protein